FLLYASSTTDIYSLSLHDALPISRVLPSLILNPSDFEIDFTTLITVPTSKSPDIVISSAYLVYLILFLIAYFAILLSRFLVIKLDRKSTRLNSSHVSISYAVFCLK